MNMRYTSGNAEFLSDDAINCRYFVLRHFPPNELGRRYEARVATGSDTPATAIRETEFFVLDLTSDPHAPEAMAAYARSCAATRPDLAANMLERFDAGDTVEATATAEPADSVSVAIALTMLHTLIASDTHAASHQSLGEYRSSILRAFGSPAIQSAVSAAAAVRRQDRLVAAGVIEQLRAALAAWPKSASQVCVEGALERLQSHFPAHTIQGANHA